ncbi:hypothetical protein GCM10029976_052770 [Kribbella albertanoniae]|uniref:Alanine-rich protein n=1 Tax=Kribbella albertanoniae TaxID=1266829 RepID=A0A4R4P1E7_9ACTN|nr:hypothetical protein [Kribbella albertanoniae]TDC16071.1 hypothetical protein E1261_39650 [Kribbella albertanoniae]
MSHGVFAYTWDLVGDPEAAARIAGLGAGTVTLQAAYHSVRGITPWHPAHRVVHAEHAAAYFPLCEDRWPGLRPLAPSWGVDNPDRFGTAAAALTAAGMAVEAWLVLTHSSAVGSAHPDVTVRNAYGERYPYALCPSHQAVRDYALTIVSEVCSQYDVDLMLEACGWLGFDHGSHHEKTEGAELSATARRLLSLCFCPACRTAIGPEADRLARAVRSAVDSELQGSGPAELVDAAALLAHRTTVIGELVSEAKSLASHRRLLLMATDDPWVTGPDVGVDFQTVTPDAFVLKCWGDTQAAVRQLKAAAERTTIPLIANVTALDTEWNGVTELLQAGASGVRYYHAGLASKARLDRIRTAVAEASA